MDKNTIQENQKTLNTIFMFLLSCGVIVNLWVFLIFFILNDFHFDLDDHVNLVDTILELTPLTLPFISFIINLFTMFKCKTIRTRAILTIIIAIIAIIAYYFFIIFPTFITVLALAILIVSIYAIVYNSYVLIKIKKDS